MAPPKKSKKDTIATAEAPAVHDVELHTAARADGLGEGIVNGRRIAFAVPGCQVCEALVHDGFSQFPPSGGRESGSMDDRTQTEVGGADSRHTTAASPAVGLVPVTVPSDLEASGAAIQAVMAAAEDIKPGLAEKLVPFLEMALGEIAAAKAAEKAEADWRAAMAADNQLMKEAFATLHNNMTYLYNLTTENVLVDLLRIKRALNIKPEK